MVVVAWQPLCRRVPQYSEKDRDKS